MSKESVTQFYEHGRFKMTGGVLPNAITAYRTYGDPKNPCIVFPTCYGGKLDREHAPDSPGRSTACETALNTDKFYIVTFALFSNGESSSPSNTPAPYNGPYFPEVSYEDNIRAQHAVVTKKLGVSKIYSVIGFSMGGQQAYYWAVMYPDIVERAIVLCGSARTSPHNQCFIEGPKSALLASKDFEDGHYKSPPQHGIRAFARAYSAWAYGQTWFRNKSYLFGGEFDSLNSFLREKWEARFLESWDANDMVTLINTWQRGDVSLVRHAGDFEACMGDIKAEVLLMPCKTDLYFPPEDSEIEMSLMRNNLAKLVVIDSVWGHGAGGGSNAQDVEIIKAAVIKFLESDWEPCP
ncbi:homoserine acetyltransferase [Artomyces pyxidatus]|uniref:Homoserine acetyltransferase n=1 Tax=Artomyces pyxidatus TaxID=48021 RepID=A0ACB8TCQ7_9AGAM|nr:homoserine acetyltransferase [Artomyces pyxidatus]